MDDGARTPPVKRTKDTLAYNKLIPELFVRPFIHRMKFLLTGVGCGDTFLFTGTPEAKMRFCVPEQAVGFVRIIDPAIACAVSAFFTELDVDLNKPGFFPLTHVCSQLNKHKWDIGAYRMSFKDTQTTTAAGNTPSSDNDESDDAEDASDDEGSDEDDASFPCQVISPHTSFVFDSLVSRGMDYVTMMSTPSAKGYDAPFEVPDTGMVFPVSVSKDTLPDDLTIVFPQGISTVLVKGVDALHLKFLSKMFPNPRFVGLRIWPKSSAAADCGFVYEHASAIIGITRLNSFLLG